MRIFFLAAVFNAVLVFASAAVFTVPALKQTPPENLIELEWIETADTVAAEPAPAPATETFAEIFLPPLEIPHTVFEPLPEIKIEPPKKIPKVEEVKPAEKVPETETPPENPADKLKVIVKVYPKDITPQLIKSGVAEENFKLKGERIVLAATITVEGKVREVEILSGGDNGGWLDLAAKNAAGGWIFEPYLDAEGTPQPLRTQIEFTPEDF